MRNVEIRIRVLAAASLALLTSALIVPASAQDAAAQPQVASDAVVNEPVHFDTSAPLRNMLMQLLSVACDLSGSISK